MQLDRTEKRMIVWEIWSALREQGYRADECCEIMLRRGAECALDAYDGRRSLEKTRAMVHRAATRMCNENHWFMYHYRNLGGSYGGTQFAKEAFFMGVNAALAWADNERRKRNGRKPRAKVL